jgi:hypothetical protein
MLLKRYYRLSGREECDKMKLFDKKKGFPEIDPKNLIF